MDIKAAPGKIIFLTLGIIMYFAPGTSRTHNLSLRTGLLYPIELQGQINFRYLF